MNATAGGARAANVDAAEVRKFDEAAHSFWDERGEFRPLHLLNPVRARFVAERAELRGARVLDVGCGGGLLAEALAKRGATVTAVDMSRSMIEVATLHAAEGGLAIDYRVASSGELVAAQPGAWDIVTCMEMIEHVPDPAATVIELARLVRPGGQVFLSTLNRNLRSFLLAIVGAEYVLRMLARGTHSYEKLIRPAELAAWGRAAGLKLREIGGLEFDPVTEQCRLTRDPSVNYLVHFVKPGPDA